MDVLTRRCIVVGAGAALVAGCLSDPPQLDDPAVQGDYDDGDEEHRPGQPCLLCHGPDHFPGPPGQVRFAVAGTVYPGIADDENDGLEGVTVSITDAEDRDFAAISNAVGNFMVQVDTGSNVQRDREPGWVTIPFEPAFPLRVTIRAGTDEQEMRTKIHRNGSCAHCHGAAPGADSVGRVYLFEEVP